MCKYLLVYEISPFKIANSSLPFHYTTSRRTLHTEEAFYANFEVSFLTGLSQERSDGVLATAVSPAMVLIFTPRYTNDRFLSWQLADTAIDVFLRGCTQALGVDSLDLLTPTKGVLDLALLNTLQCAQKL